MAGEGRGELFVFPDVDRLASEAVRWIGRRLVDAIDARGEAHLVLSGGTTPLPTYRGFAAASWIPWSRVALYWGDERCVAPDAPSSNYGAARRAWLEATPNAVGSAHRIPAELGAERAAEVYESDLRRVFGAERPAFDVVLLGLGSDGHTASLFPGHNEEESRWVSAARAPEPPTDRVTLTTRALSAGRDVVFLVSGAGKAEALESVLRQPDSDLPAAGVARASRRVTWLLDRSSARGLDLG